MRKTIDMFLPDYLPNPLPTLKWIAYIYIYSLFKHKNNIHPGNNQTNLKSVCMMTHVFSLLHVRDPLALPTNSTPSSALVN